MSIGPPIPEIQHFQSLTLKIQGQGHSSRSQRRYTTLSIHILFVPCQSALPFLGYSYFKISHWKFKVKVMGEVKVSHNMGPTFSWLTSLWFHTCQLALPFLRYSIFKVWPWKSKVKVIAQGHKEGIPPYRFISFSFHVNRPSHSWDTAILKFHIENSRSRSWARSKLKSQHGSNIQLTHIPLVPCQLALSFLGYSYFKIWHWKFNVKVMGEVKVLKSQHGSNIQSTHIPFIPCQSGIQFLSYDFSKIWPWKSRVKVMGEVKVESHNMGPTFSRLTSLSFHVDRASQFWVTTFSKFDLENQGSRSWVRSQFKVIMWV